MANVSVLHGSYRSARQGIKAARFIVRKIEERGHSVTLIDAKEHDLPMLDRMHKEFDEAPANLARIHDILEASDGFVLVAGEYNHSVQPGLKNLLDHFQREYFFKPAGIVSYSTGPFGGLRMAVHLRAILGELGMVSLPTILAVSKVRTSFDDEGKALDESYEKRAVKFLDELDWYLEALARARKDGTPY